MTDTTYDAARRCSKCGELGELTKKEPFKARYGDRRNVTSGAQLHTIVCMNERCKWYETVCRLIQVNPDGTIPTPVAKRDKMFPKIPDLTQQVNDSLARQLGVELQGGGEVTNR
jgi:hypothetical protein